MVSWCFTQPLAYMLTMCRQSVYPAHDSQGSTNQSVYDTMPCTGLRSQRSFMQHRQLRMLLSKLHTGQSHLLPPPRLLSRCCCAHCIAAEDAVQQATDRSLSSLAPYALVTLYNQATVDCYCCAPKVWLLRKKNLYFY